VGQFEIKQTGFSFSVYGKLSGMGEPRLRVVEWHSGTPVIAVCPACRKEFKVPMSLTGDAQEYLQQQYDQHKCKDCVE
jgi:hypothetical protein